MFRSLLRTIGFASDDPPAPDPQQNKPNIPVDNTEQKKKKLDEDWNSFSDESILQGGAMLMEYDTSYKDGMGLGKVVFGLVDIPIGKKYLTANGNFVERTDAYTVFVAGKTISIKKEALQEKSQVLQQIEAARQIEDERWKKAVEENIGQEQIKTDTVKLETKEKDLLEGYQREKEHLFDTKQKDISLEYNNPDKISKPRLIQVKQNTFQKKLKDEVEKRSNKRMKKI